MMGAGRLFAICAVLGASPAAADPSSNSSTTSTSATPVSNAAPLTRAPSAQPFRVFDPPKPVPPSLRLEAIRVAGERADNDWRYPGPGPIVGMEHGIFYVGYFHYRPRSARSAALHGGSMAATLLGEILLESGTPAAGVGALLTGATLDAAAADVDRDVESRKKR